MYVKIVCETTHYLIILKNKIMEKENKLNIDDYKFLSHIIKAHIVDSYNEYDIPIDTKEHINKLKNVFNKLETELKK
jgi:hypothetical protein